MQIFSNVYNDRQSNQIFANNLPAVPLLDDIIHTFELDEEKTVRREDRFGYPRRISFSCSRSAFSYPQLGRRTIQFFSFFGSLGTTPWIRSSIIHGDDGVRNRICQSI